MWRGCLLRIINIKRGWLILLIWSAVAAWDLRALLATSFNASAFEFVSGKLVTISRHNAVMYSQLVRKVYRDFVRHGWVAHPTNFDECALLFLSVCCGGFANKVMIKNGQVAKYRRWMNSQGSHQCRFCRSSVIINLQILVLNRASKVRPHHLDFVTFNNDKVVWRRVKSSVN